jgi:hypothetical protein
MQGHVPVPPQPHLPQGLAPVLGYMATREPQPLDERAPVEPEWWEMDDEDTEWPAHHRRSVKVVAVILSLALVVAGLGTVLEVILSAH